MYLPGTQIPGGRYYEPCMSPDGDTSKRPSPTPKTPASVTVRYPKAGGDQYHGVQKEGLTRPNATKPNKNRQVAIQSLPPPVLQCSHIKTLFCRICDQVDNWNHLYLSIFRVDIP